jgi:hypothetical protein
MELFYNKIAMREKEGELKVNMKEIIFRRLLKNVQMQGDRNPEE